MVLVGIGGMVRSGKDTLADILIAEGYFGFSFGDYVRERAMERHADKPDPISVENMTETSNWLRENHGPDVVLVAALKQFESLENKDDYKGIVLYSVRMKVEVDFILGKGGHMVWVEASPEVRHARGLKAMREGEAVITLEEFKRQEALQWTPQPGIPEEVQMNLSYVKENASLVIENEHDDLESFEAAAKKQLDEYLHEQDGEHAN